MLTYTQDGIRAPLCYFYEVMSYRTLSQQDLGRPFCKLFFAIAAKATACICTYMIMYVVASCQFWSTACPWFVSFVEPLL